MKLTSAPFWRLTCFIRKIKRLQSIQGSDAALLFSLIAFSVLFQWLIFEEAFIKVVKLSVSILEEDSVHLFHLQLYFFSNWNTGIEDYAVYRWAVAFFCFFDLFCWSVIITSIQGSIHEGHEAFSEHSRGLRILQSIREVSFDQSMVDLQKIRPIVHYVMSFNKPICSFFTLTSINPKNQHLNQKNYYLVIIYCMYFIHLK